MHELLALTVIMSETLASSYVVRLERDSRLWMASVPLLPPGLHRGVVPPAAETPVLIANVLFAAVWVALMVALKRRRRAFALPCVWICGGLATAIVLLSRA